MTQPKLKLKSIIPPTLKLKHPMVVVNDNALIQQQPPTKHKHNQVTATIEKEPDNIPTKSLLSKIQLLKLEEYLSITYPLCFVKRPDMPKPLALGMHKQLQKLELSKNDSLLTSNTIIKKFLTVYTGRKKYKKAFIIYKDRFNLDGSISTKLTNEHIDAALMSIKPASRKI